MAGCDPLGPGVISRTIKGSGGIEKLTKTTRMLHFNESRGETLDLQLCGELSPALVMKLTFIIREGSKAKFKKAI